MSSRGGPSNGKDAREAESSDSTQQYGEQVKIKSESQKLEEQEQEPKKQGYDHCEDLCLLIRAAIWQHAGASLGLLISEISPYFLGLLTVREKCFYDLLDLPRTLQTHLRYIDAFQGGEKYFLANSEPPSGALVKAVRDTALQRIIAQNSENRGRTTQGEPARRRSPSKKRRSSRGHAGDGRSTFVTPQGALCEFL